MNKNRITALILAAVSILFLVMAYMLPESKFGTSVGADIFPYIAAGGLLLCSVALFFRKESEKDKVPFLDKAGWLRVLKATVVLLLFPFIFQYLGFFPASLFLLFFLIRMFDLEKEAPVWKVALITVVITTVLYVLFRFVLGTRLPSGELFELLKG